MTIDELNRIEELSDVQYVARGIIDGQSIDREIAEEPCSVCGKVRQYRAVFDDSSYRAFSVCLTCDDVQEF